MISDIAGFAYDCKNVDELANFYIKLLGWRKLLFGNGWAGFRSPQGWIFAFQDIEEYEHMVLGKWKATANGVHRCFS